MRLTLVAIAIIIASCNATLESTEIGRQQDTSVINGDRVLSVLDSNPSKQLLRTAETSDVDAGNIQARRLAEKMSPKLVKKLLKDSGFRKQTFDDWNLGKYPVTVYHMKESLDLSKKKQAALLKLYEVYKGV
ncbi:hypothetical protein PHYPSEUDO_013211 [Phytophthora pseudosyringae]|uniref:RxLR effector protein n=1 Tax=Phytophthora pseudosyringae TaxID=221518 RepID=A0A8T1V865_9STRA|nr:hypothetical protein PHYPSEUDO_013211 [Phytophthora pseudosyringae]